MNIHEGQGLTKVSVNRFQVYDGLNKPLNKMGGFRSKYGGRYFLFYS